MANDRIVDLYEQNAAAWAQQRGRGLDESPWLDRFLARVPAGGSILDIGCGMGEPIARSLIERGFAVTGIDSSPALIAMADARYPGQEWIVADMRTLDLGRRFDGLIAWHSFFHPSSDDQRPMFARFAAHAGPCAPLLFTSGPEHGEAIGEWMGELLYHGSLDPAEYEALLEGHGFEGVTHKLHDPNCGSATVWLAIRARSLPGSP